MNRRSNEMRSTLNDSLTLTLYWIFAKSWRTVSLCTERNTIIFISLALCTMSLARKLIRCNSFLPIFRFIEDDVNKTSDAIVSAHTNGYAPMIIRGLTQESRAISIAQILSLRAMNRKIVMEQKSFIAFKLFACQE